jgi:hypothetical protein
MHSQWLVDLVNNWMLDTSDQKVERRGAMTIARYSWRVSFAMGICSLLWLGVVIAAALMLPGLKLKVVFCGLFVAFLLPTAWWWLEARAWYAEFDDKGVMIRRPFRSTIKLRWVDVRSVEYNSLAKWYVVRSRLSPKLRVHDAVVGGDLLVKMARSHLVRGAQTHKSAIANRK